MAYTCIDDGAPVLKVTDTNELVLVTYLDWAYMCEDLRRTDNVIDEYDIVRKCVSKIESVTGADSTYFSYKDLLNEHMKKRLTDITVFL